jgi:hypothetical protein
MHNVALGAGQTGVFQTRSSSLRTRVKDVLARAASRRVWRSASGPGLRGCPRQSARSWIGSRRSTMVSTTANSPASGRRLATAGPDRDRPWRRVRPRGSVRRPSVARTVVHIARDQKKRPPHSSRREKNGRATKPRAESRPTAGRTVQEAGGRHTPPPYVGPFLCNILLML